MLPRTEGSVKQEGHVVPRPVGSIATCRVANLALQTRKLWWMSRPTVTLASRLLAFTFDLLECKEPLKNEKKRMPKNEKKRNWRKRTKDEGKKQTKKIGRHTRGAKKHQKKHQKHQKIERK